MLIEDANLTTNDSNETTTLAPHRCFRCPSAYEGRKDDSSNCIGCFVPGFNDCVFTNCIKFCSQASECTDFCVGSPFGDNSFILDAHPLAFVNVKEHHEKVIPNAKVCQCELCSREDLCMPRCRDINHCPSGFCGASTPLCTDTGCVC